MKRSICLITLVMMALCSAACGKKEETESVPDINDYLVTYDVSEENFDEFFEIVPVVEKYDENQEPEFYDILLVSKKYDEGLIYYDCEGGFFNLDFKENNGTYSIIIGESFMQELFFTGTGHIKAEFLDTAELVFNDNSLKMTYLKKDYVKEITPVKQSYEDLYTIVLLDGTEIERSWRPDYPY
ncbi:MAG: hypothetical protein IKR67_07175 [Lachnospiraceae bacterium]|nr:hypothetical protein [Lachnospiraceae bacterium]